MMGRPSPRPSPSASLPDRVRPGSSAVGVVVGDGDAVDGPGVEVLVADASSRLALPAQSMPHVGANIPCALDTMLSSRSPARKL